MIHLIARGRLEDREHVRREPIAEGMGAERSGGRRKKPGDRPRILVVNDDGVHGEGLEPLIGAILVDGRLVSGPRVAESASPFVRGRTA